MTRSLALTAACRAASSRPPTSSPSSSVLASSFFLLGLEPMSKFIAATALAPSTQCLRDMQKTIPGSL
eukprot:CAMPEP_0183361758 /NCGR_PEP_ID=MMETSP0164_2-20130417/63748_1 /TAXON_ID=221442 /ORGANISM="Coccolithus pelagicus ssp braarudi, Strain PLY182g" /LENGTH=67 /DNA_ID=CAMNT_0025536435 /DNA_START=32 /DNA_END=232 /DNA_ORIENTATION=+